MASVLDIIKHYQQGIEKNPHDEARVLRCIDKLFHLQVTVQHLQETGVGRTVNALRKEPGDVGKAARALVNRWKVMVAAEESDQDGDHKTETTIQNGHASKTELENYSQSSKYESPAKSIQKEQHHNESNGHHSSSKRKYHSGEEKENEAHKKSKYTGEEDYKKTVEIKKENSESENEESSDDSDSSDSEDSDSYSSASSQEESKPKIEIKKEVKKEVKKEKESYETHKSSSSKPSQNEHSERKKSSNESSSSSSHHSDKKTHHSSTSKDSPRKSSESASKSSSHKHKSSHEKENSSDKRHKSDSEHEKRESKSSSKSSSDKHKSSSHKHDSSTERHKSSSERHSSKESKSSSHSEKEKDKHKSSSKESSSKHRSKEASTHSSKDKHSSSSKERSKDKSSSSKEKSSSHSDNKKIESKSHKSEKSKHSEKSSKDKSSSSSSSHKSKSSSSSSQSKDVPKKKSKGVNSEDSEDGIDCGSGASFAEALGMMISPPKPKKKTTQMKDIGSPNGSFSNDLSPASMLAPTAKLAPLPAIEISALPEISPQYKPRPPPKLLPHFSDEDAISAGISTKNQRTKVYSGNKAYGKIPSLYEMCVHVLQEHIDALEYTGGVPYEILKPVVDRATPQQLFVLEHYNPYLVDDTDHLWQKYCQKSFRNKQRQEMESWREMYIRCQEEQESKLKSLTANIKLTQEAKKAPIKQTKMAYVDTIVKPPRNIARKQALHGTAHAASASPAARVASLSATSNVLKGSARPTLPTISIPSSFKPKKAPLMQKALQIMRGRKR